MKEYYSYITTTGEIAKSGYITDDAIPRVATNQTIVMGKQTYPDYYHNLSTNTLEARPSLDIENGTIGIDVELISANIPEGTIVIVDDEEVGIADNDGLSLVFPVAKTYNIVLKPPFPYFEKTISIEVTP